MAERDLDEVVLVIQEAASKLDSASQHIEGFDGKQDELIASVKILTERVTELEEAAAAPRAKTQRKKKPASLHDRNLVRAVYHDLSHTVKFKMDQNYESSDNQAVIQQILTEVGVRQPSCDRELILSACERYFLSLYEDHKRAVNGTKEKYRIQQRRLRRKKLKLTNRQKIFEKSPPPTWSSTRKSRVKQILDMGLSYISSEDSGDDTTTLYRRPLSWIKSKYTNSMKLLDEIHYNSLSVKSRGMVRKREDREPSNRSVPSKPLEFAVVQAIDDTSLDTSADIDQ